MDFKQYFNLFVEKYLSYQIPADRFDPDTGKKLFGSKEKLLYDFYVLSYLSQFNLDDNVGPKKSGTGELMQSATMRRELDVDTKESLEDAKKTLLTFLKKSLSNAVFFAVCAEFRHIYDINENRTILKFAEERNMTDFIKKYTIQYKGRSTSLKEFLTNRTKINRERYKHDQRGYYDSYASVKQTKVEESEFISFAEKAFSELAWRSNYGGKAWANICSGWLRLHRAKSENELFVAIDHIYDLQHNTDTVFNKLHIYKKDGNFKWIKDALDHKANVSSPYELLNKCSGTIKMIAQRVLKSEGFDSWEGFIRKKKEAEEQRVNSQLGKINNFVNNSYKTHNIGEYDDVFGKDTNEITVKKVMNMISMHVPNVIPHISVPTTLTGEDLARKFKLFYATRVIPYILNAGKFDWYEQKYNERFKTATTLGAAASVIEDVELIALINNAPTYVVKALDIKDGLDPNSLGISGIQRVSFVAYALEYAIKFLPETREYFIKGMKQILSETPESSPPNSENPPDNEFVQLLETLATLSPSPEQAKFLAHKWSLIPTKLTADKFTEDLKIFMVNDILPHFLNDEYPDVAYEYNKPLSNVQSVELAKTVILSLHIASFKWQNKLTESALIGLRDMLSDVYQMLWENKTNMAIIQLIVKIVKIHFKKVNNSISSYFTKGVVDVLKGEQGMI